MDDDVDRVLFDEKVIYHGCYRKLPCIGVLKSPVMMRVASR